MEGGFNGEWRKVGGEARGRRAQEYRKKNVRVSCATFSTFRS